MKSGLLIFLLSLSLLTTGCGGGSGSGSNSGNSDSAPTSGSGGSGDNSDTDATIPTSSGTFDTIQACFEDTVNSVIPAELPLLGTGAQQLLLSLNTALDVPEALWLGLENVIVTQDPQEFLYTGTVINASLQTFADNLTTAILQLTDTDNLFGGTPVEVITLRGQLSNLVIQLQSGLVGPASTGDLSVLTALLNDISTSLDDITALIPLAVQDASAIAALLSSLVETVAGTSDILTAASTLDALAFQAANDAILTTISTNIVGMLPLTAGVGSKLAQALASANSVMDNGFGILSVPLFNSLDLVLTPNTGPIAPLADILGGVIGNDLSEIGGLAALSELLEGGTNAAPLLSTELSGLPFLGDLLGALTGSDLGGLDVITELLNGALTDINNLPVTIGSLIANFPGLGGGIDGLPLLLVTDLVTGLLSLNVVDVSIIESSLGTFLNSGNGGGTGFDIPAIASGIQGDPLLGGILGGLGPLCTQFPSLCL